VARLIFSMVVIACGGFGCAAATAQAAPSAASPPKKTLHVLTEAQVDPSRLLPPPAKEGSDQQAAELADVQKAHETATPERRAQAEWDAQHESVELFFATLGPKFDLQQLTATAKLMKTVENEQSVAANIAKRYFQRKRPWASNTSLVPCDYKPNAPPLTSYPSGHATLGYSEGFILAALMPEKAQAILARSEQYAYSRVVCGAHYPGDIEASHVLGTELAMMMMEEPKFVADFKAAKTELRGASLTQ
jgi:acid phosphatase (class A)